MIEADRRDAEAAEFVLGVVSRGDREHLAKRLCTDPAFAKAVLDWETLLLPLNAEYEARPVPVRVKTAIDRRLFDGQVQSRFWPSQRLARLGALTAGGATAFLIFVLTLFPEAPTLTAELDGLVTGYSFTVSVHKDEARITVLTVEGDRPRDRDFELWAIVEDSAPVSVGVLPASGRFQLPPDLSLSEGMTLAVSLEPLGGSPTGAPTGPVLSTGVLRDV